jgi:peptidyl-prolyl cis-trans isomerase A (cyclophilin A)
MTSSKPSAKHCSQAGNAKRSDAYAFLHAVGNWMLLGIAVLLAGCVDVGACVEDSSAVRVLLDTEAGPVVVEVYPSIATASAGDFLRYVDEHHYDGASFYRVVRPDNDSVQPKIQVVQGGVRGDLQARRPVEHESTKETGLRHVDGALSLPRSVPGMASAAGFFISVGSNPALDYGGGRQPDGQGFAVFGRVVSGMDVIRRIHASQSNGATDNERMKGQMLDRPVVIRRATRLTTTTIGLTD